MIISIPLASGIFLVGAASGGLLAHLRWIAVAWHIRKEITEQLETALYAKRRLAESNRGYKTDTTTDLAAIRTIVEQKELEIAQTRAEIDALRTVIQLLEEPDEATRAYSHRNVPMARA
jgi:hypothetical protein